MTALSPGRGEGREETTRCRGCGARYRVSYALTPVRVADSFNCQLCRCELSSWSGFLVPRHSLVRDDVARLWQGHPDRAAVGG